MIPLVLLFLWGLPAALCALTGFGPWIAGISWLWFIVIVLGWVILAHVITIEWGDYLGEEAMERRTVQNAHENVRSERAKRRARKGLIDKTIDGVERKLFGSSPEEAGDDAGDRYFERRMGGLDITRRVNAPLRFFMHSLRWVPPLIVLAARIIIQYDLLGKAGQQ